MHLHKALTGAALLLLVAACSNTVGRSISRDHVGTKYAKLQGYFRAADMVEEVPGDIRHDAVLDEAILTKAGDAETCAEVTIRTARRYDEPISQQSPTCQAAGQTAEAIADNVTISVYDYSYAGRIETVAVDAVALDEYVGLSISEPAEKIFRVVERKATVCCPISGHSGVELTFENSRMDYNNLAYGLGFDWKLQ
jgi:hypothetical protein